MYSRYLLFSSQFKVYISHELRSPQILKIKMTEEFLLFKKNTDIDSYFVKGFKISKELKRLSEDVHKFLMKTTMSNLKSNKFTIFKPVKVLGN